MAFNEIYESGVVRPLYRKYLTADSKRTESERKRALKVARALVSGDANFLPLVRLVTAREYKLITEGVRQRGRALQLFLTDHYFGVRFYEQAGILTKAQVDAIKHRYPVPQDHLPLRPENIQFWYAPDTVRDENGNFRVIEDNIGFVGGMGDLEAFAEAAKILGVSIQASRHPHSFYRGIVESYKREARNCGGGKTILLSHPKGERWNHEDHRFERVLASFDVTPVTNLRSLRVREDGLYHQGERVGFVIMNMNSEEIEPADSSNKRIAGFWKSMGQGHFGVSYAPGLEFVGDKNFCPHVEALVEFYLGEKCVLPTLPTLRLTNSKSQQKILAERESWVIKLCKGQSGESVWVGRHVTSLAWAKLLRRVEKNPRNFIAQKFCESSRFLDYCVDLRPLAVITPLGEHVSPIPWGRAARNGKSKTNISCGGLLAPIAVIPGY